MLLEQRKLVFVGQVLREKSNPEKAGHAFSGCGAPV